ncbi:MAG: tRNA (N6-isopentenyl adenosine(37)-C2)-methylthiotransferase MiaB [Candidatus Omnitrophica bacterium]|nr:tRNA (N6-isopentenyl adenosine(37)-C2)-methylthiotransferase MiaB [Candidatus Omnitrophota bacterium]
MQQTLNNPLKIVLKTFGCQMNEYDTELAAGLLVKEGYQLTTEDSKADAVIFNTCSVREHAEDRVFGQLGSFSHQKSVDGRKLILGVMGCMSENYKTGLFKRFPELDFIVGTRNVKDVPRVLSRVIDGKKRQVALDEEGLGIEYSEFTRRGSAYHAWLPIMTGCDKVCTFCIVPKTRGREISKPAAEVTREVKRLAGEGFKAVTLLGQNVNSYGKDFAATAVTFPKLLAELSKISGIEMISFTTSHPSDAVPELFEVIRDNPKITRRFHLPLQSGSDKILKRMKRLHTLSEYRAKVDLLRTMIPEIALTTDIIVGFPGETPEDFDATRHALEQIGFDSAFIYKYSARPGTPAEALVDDVPLEEKKRRNSELLDLQERITESRNLKLIGSVQKGIAGKENVRVSGEIVLRTWTDKKIVVPGAAADLGKIMSARITKLVNETFLGEVYCA